MSKSKEIIQEEINFSTDEKKVVQEIKQPEKSIKKVEDVSLMAKTKTYGLTYYLQRYPQNKYVEAALKSQYSKEQHTIADWDKIVANIKKRLGITN